MIPACLLNFFIHYVPSYLSPTEKKCSNEGTVIFALQIILLKYLLLFNNINLLTWAIYQREIEILEPTAVFFCIIINVHCVNCDGLYLFFYSILIFFHIFQFFGQFGHTFMEFLCNSGEYCQAQHVHVVVA